MGGLAWSAKAGTANLIKQEGHSTEVARALGRSVCLIAIFTYSRCHDCMYWRKVAIHALMHWGIRHSTGRYGNGFEDPFSLADAILI